METMIRRLNLSIEKNLIYIMNKKNSLHKIEDANAFFCNDIGNGVV